MGPRPTRPSRPPHLTPSRSTPNPNPSPHDPHPPHDPIWIGGARLPPTPPLLRYPAALPTPAPIPGAAPPPLGLTPRRAGLVTVPSPPLLRHPWRPEADVATHRRRRPVARRPRLLLAHIFAHLQGPVRPPPPFPPSPPPPRRRRSPRRHARARVHRALACAATLAADPSVQAPRLPPAAPVVCCPPRPVPAMRSPCAGRAAVGLCRGRRRRPLVASGAHACTRFARPAKALWATDIRDPRPC